MELENFTTEFLRRFLHDGDVSTLTDERLICINDVFECYAIQVLKHRFKLRDEKRADAVAYLESEVETIEAIEKVFHDEIARRSGGYAGFCKFISKVKKQKKRSRMIA